MAKKTEFEQKIADDIKHQSGALIPVKASLLERLLVRKAPCDKLHPNAEDEFTFDTVGPSYKIIGEYEEKFRTAIRRNMEPFDDPLIVEKLRPSGYLLINGHHRWAAAMRVGIKKVPIQIVNLAQDSDIDKILENSKHDKRVTLDLDEVIFREKGDKWVENVPTLKFMKFDKKIKYGIPALFYYLSKNGYDIWVYSANYYSIDDIQRFFRHYDAHVDGIITGTIKNNKDYSERAARLQKKIEDKYKVTIHIDNDMLVATGNVGAKFKTFDLDAAPDEWARKAIEIIGEIGKDEAKK